jgi:hypothetical protein
MPFGTADARTYVQRFAELANSIDDAARTGVYVWSS